MSDGEIEATDDWRKHRPYGGGIKRKRIEFVAAGSSAAASAISSPTNSASGVASQYLAIVLPKQRQDQAPDTTFRSATSLSLGKQTQEATPTTPDVRSTSYPICEVCKLPITDPEKHPQSTVHQYAIPHSFPPHHYSRSSKGLKYLVEQGWDPDKRVGLGVEEQGGRFPLKPEPKYDTLGIGVKKRGSSAPLLESTQKKKLNAKQASIEAEREKKRRKQLQEYLFSA